MLTEHDIPLLERITGRPMHDRRGSGGKRDLVATYVADTIADTEPTPIVEIGVVVAGRARSILLKLDGCSRWGSIKGRTALALLASIAHRVDGRSRVVESTSGNLGVALAGICRDLDIPFTAVVDARLQPGMRSRLAHLGAHTTEIERTTDGTYLQRRIARVRSILAEDDGARWTNQYENKANVAVHRWWTGPELGRQLPWQPQVVFSSVSTGGSFAGLRAYLAADHPAVECVAVDVAGSTIFGGAPAHRLLTGIGASKPSAFIGEHSLPPYVMVTDTEAIAICRALAGDTGIGVGGSSGAAIAGCLRYLSDRPELDHVLCMCPDMASNYAETLYDDDWLVQAGIAEAMDRPCVGGQSIRFANRTAGWDTGNWGDRHLAGLADPALQSSN